MKDTNHSYIYNVEILIEDINHQQALTQILNKLNSLGVIDYKITSGVQLGKEIQARKQDATLHQAVPVISEQLKPATTKKEATRENKEEKQAEVKKASSQISDGLDLLKSYKDKNKLIRLIVNRGLGIKLSIPCRVLNIDEDGLISIYHVDEKQVYTFRLIEIEDIIVV